MSTPPPVPRDRLHANLAGVHARIAAAAERAGRSPDAVRLIAVTKTVGPATLADLQRLGQCDFGESRVQLARDKQTALAATLPPADLATLRWHLIGPLQANKVNLALKLFDTLHAVDSDALAAALSQRLQAARVGEVRTRFTAASAATSAVTSVGAPPPPPKLRRDPAPLPVFLEVNVSGEATKRGVTVAAARDLAPRIAAHPRLRLIGLMTMAPFDAPPAILHHVFGTLRSLRDELQAATVPTCTELSMGMSDDFETAIEEGATQVRVGRALFL
ncbi:MAG: YggS family pyridoxal phosphate enzyme [Planctomycetota bacterium]